MRTRWLIIGVRYVLVLAVLICGCGSRRVEQTKASVNTGLPNATMAEARRLHKPVMAEVTAEWCEACKLLKKEVLSRPEVVAAARQFVVLTIDGDKQADLKKRLEVSGYPTIIFFDSNGRELGRVRGAVPYQILLKEMDSAAKKAG
jgi:thiol:disulfide interchange protein